LISAGLALSDDIAVPTGVAATHRHAVEPAKAAAAPIAAPRTNIKSFGRNMIDIFICLKLYFS
jgi:hypothetical protein